MKKVLIVAVVNITLSLLARWLESRAKTVQTS